MSYAYFTGMILGEGKEIRVSAKELRILFTDDMELANSTIIPGWKETKIFSVKNESGNIFNYNISIKDLINTFVSTGYLQYKITSDKVPRIYTDELYRNAVWKANPPQGFVDEYLKIVRLKDNKEQMLEALQLFYAKVKQGIELGEEYSIPIGSGLKHLLLYLKNSTMPNNLK